jgi:hypothetical protein
MMKKLLLFFVLSLSLVTAYSQNAFSSGDGWGLGWGTPDYFSATGFGGTQGKTFVNSNAGPASRYFRLYTNFGGCVKEWQPNGSVDQQITPGTKYTTTSVGTAKAFFFTSVNATDNYRIHTRIIGECTTPEFVAFKIAGTPATITSVSDASAGQARTITAVTSGAGNLPSGQGLYVRYSTDNFATSVIAPMNALNGTSNTYTATTIAYSAGSSVKYYVLTSGSGLTISHADADFFTINGINNGGSNYSYTVPSLSSSALINPAADGGFENGSTLTANGWTTAGSSDAWVVGSATSPGVSAGSRAGYISPDGGTTWSYSQVSTFAHLYKDVTIPAGESKMTLSFKWKVGGEGTTTSDWDNMKVFFVPTSVTPVSGTAISATYQISGPGAISNMYKLSSASYNTETIIFNNTLGTTGRLVFTWKSDVSTIANPPAAIDEVSLTSAVPSTYTWNATTGSAAWNVAANWTPARTTPAASDILQFINGGSSTATTIAASETVSRIVVANNTTIYLQASATATLTIASDGTSADELTVAGGSSLISNGSTAALSIAYNGTGSTGNIAGTMEVTSASGTIVNTISFTGGTTPITTVTGTLANGQSGGTGTPTITGSAATLIMASGSIYNHKFTSLNGALPTATWNAASNCNVTGYTASGLAPTNIAQTFGNFTWNCTGQAAGNSNLSLSSTTFNIAGTLNILSTGTTGSFILSGTGSYTTNIGSINQTGGIFNLANGALGTGVVNITGSLTQTGGTFVSTGTTTCNPTINFNGTANQAVSFTTAPTGPITYRISNAAGITLTGPTATFPLGNGTLGGLRISTTSTTPVTFAGTSTSFAYNAANSTLTYDAAGATTARALEFPATSGPTNLTTNLGTNNVLTLPFSRTVGGTLTMTSGDIDISTNTLTLGTAAATPGTLTWTAGSVRLTTGAMTRWFGTTGLPIAAGTAIGYYPIANSANNRNVSVYFSTATALSTGGSITVTHNATGGLTTIASPLTETQVMDRRTNATWTFNQANLVATGTILFRLTSGNLLTTATPANLHVILATPALAPGTNVAGAGTSPNFQFARAGLSVANITNQTYAIGAAAVDVASVFNSIATGNYNSASTWDANAVPTSTDVVNISSGTTVTLDAASVANTLTVNAGGILTAAANSLTTTTTLTNNGTINASGATITATTTLTNSGTINATAGNINVTGAATTGITNNAGATINVNGGTITVGAAGGSNRTFNNNGSVTVSSGTLNVNGNFLNTSSVGNIFTQIGGDINVDGNAAGVTANSVLTLTPIVKFTSGTPTTVLLNGGTFTIVDPHAGTGTTDYALSANISTATNCSTSHTFRFGDGVSTDVGGNTNGFYMYLFPGTSYLILGNVLVNGGSGTNRFVSTSSNIGILGNLTINSGSEYRISSTNYISGNIVNNGTLTTTSTLSIASYANAVVAASANAQTISGTGVFRNLAAASTANLTSLTVNNTNATGLTLNVPLSVSGTLTMTSGLINTNSTYLLTLGTTTAVGTLSCTPSITNMIVGPFARTFAASTTATGTYTATTLFPIGKNGAVQPMYIDPTTAASGAVTLSGEAFTTNSGTFSSPVTSLSSNRWEGLITSGTANFTSANIRLNDAASISTSKILQSSTPAGAYVPIIPSITFTAGTPNSLTTTGTQILAADYLGYFAYGALTPCSTPTAQPTALVVTNKTTTTINGSFTAASPTASHYLVVRYPAGSAITAPVDYAIYTAGAALGLGTIVSSSVATSVSISGLTSNTAYDIYVYSYNNSGCYGPVYNSTSPLMSSVTTCATATGASGTPTSSLITTTSFTATWTASATAGVDYEIDVATNSGFTTFVSGYNALNVGTGILTANITGLNASTTYYVRVRAIIAGCSSTNSTSLVVTTACNPVTAFSQNFDAITTPAFPSCWAKVGTTGTTNTQASTVMSAPNNLYIYSTSTAAANLAFVSMPPVSNLNAGTHRLTFKARSNVTVGGIVEVGYLTNPYDVATYTMLGSFTTTSTTAIDNFILSPVVAPAGVTTLAFRHTGSPANSLLIDDVVYEPIPPPVVTGFTSSVVCGASTLLTITGTNLGGATVSIGGTAITPLTTNTATQIAATVNATVSGLITVTTIGGSGNSSSNMTFTVAPAITLTPTSVTRCFNDAPSAISVSSGNANYAYSWLPASGLSTTSGTSVSASPTVTTSYTVTATDAGTGCVAVGSIPVTVNSNPTTPVMTPSAAAICNGANQVLSGSSSPSPTILTENFDNGLGSFTNVTESGHTATNAACNWVAYTPPTTYSTLLTSWTGLNNTGYVMVNSDAAGNGGGATDKSLVSSTFSTVGYSVATIGFKYMFRTSATTTVDYSTNGGTTWVSAGTFTPTSTIVTAPTASTASIAAPAGMLGQASVKIRFRYTATWQYYWAIDDVAITGTPVAATYAWSGSPAGTAGLTTSNVGTITVTPTASTVYTLVATNAAGCTASNTATLTVNAATANAGADATVNCTTPSTTLTATGGTSYVWNNSVTQGGTVSPTTTTTYVVTVTDANGCTATDDVTITADKTAPTASAGADATINCTTTSATLTATGGGTYKWNNATAATTASVQVATGGNYTVTVTGANGCTATDDVSITVDNTAPTAYAGADATVNCTTPSTTLSATGGTSYAWNNSATQGGAVTPTVTTTYTVTVTGANGCTSTDDVTITVNKTAPTASAGADATVDINTPSATLTATGGVSYAWSNGVNIASNSVSPTVTTTYVVTVTGANGCTATDDVTVTADRTPPTANAGADLTVNCTTTSRTLTATGGVSYAWSNGANLASTAVSPTVTTTYTVTVTAANGATATDDVTVTADFATPTASAGVDVTINCITPSTTLTATGGTGYAWDNGATQGGSVSPATTTTYTVTVTAANGCTSTATKTVTVDKGAPTANAGSDVTVTCASPSATLTATGGTGYAWSNGATTASTSVTPSATTTYTVTVTAANGCTATDDVQVATDQNIPTINAGADVTVTCTTQSATLTATSSTGTLLWSTGASTAAIIVTPTATTTYSVTITAANGCKVSDDVVVTVDQLLPTANAGADITANCTTPTATLTATGGVSYAWNNSVTQGVAFTPVTSRNYTVTVTGANGCKATDAVFVTVDKTAPTANAGADATVTCAAPATTLTATGGASYAWSNGTVTAANSVSPTANTTYMVTVTGANGCKATDDVAVVVNQTAPTANAGADATVTCAAPATTLTATGGVSYAWSNGTATATNTVSPTANTTYTVTVTGANGCKATDDVVVVVDKVAPTANAGADVSVDCATSSAVLTATGGVSYVWSSGAITATTTVSPAATTTYTVTVTGANGCTATDNVLVSSDKGSFSATVSPDVTLTCANPTTTLVASGGSNYVWNTGATTPSITVTVGATTTYYVTITGGNGCAGAEDIVVTYKNIATVTCPAATTVNVDAAQCYATNLFLGLPTVTGVCTIASSVPSLSGSTVTAATHFPTGANTVTWTVTDGGANVHTCAQTVTVKDNILPVLTVPANTTISCADAVPAIVAGTATDNCGITGVTNTQTSTKGAAGTCTFYTYTITRTWTATDVNGNTKTASQLITVRDITAPVLSAVPANITIGQTGTYTVATLTATDNCSAATVAVNTTISTPAIRPACYSVYENIVNTWTATDVCGNTSTGRQVITRADLVQLTCPANLVLNTNSDGVVNDNCSTVVKANNGMNPVFSDICDLSVLKHSVIGTTSIPLGNGTVAGLVFNKGLSTVTYTALSRTCSFTITINDNEVPKIAATNLSIVEDACAFTATPASPTATDNCAVTSFTVSSDVTATVSGCSSKAATLKYFQVKTRTWTATDASTNATTAVQRIYLRDMAAPTPICQDITATPSTNANANVTVLATQINNGSFDNCTNMSALSYAICRGASCTNFAASLSLPISLIPTGQTFTILPVTLRVTDACGNVNMCNANIRFRKFGTTLANNNTTTTLSETADAAIETPPTPTVPSDIDATHGSMKCFPNPFADDLNINYNLTSDVEDLVIKVYDNQGKLVKVNAQGESLAGYYQMRWNLSDLPSGMYHVCLEADGKCLKVERVILTK